MPKSHQIKRKYFTSPKHVLTFFDSLLFYVLFINSMIIIIFLRSILMLNFIKKNPFAFHVGLLCRVHSSILLFIFLAWCFFIFFFFFRSSFWRVVMACEWLITSHCYNKLLVKKKNNALMPKCCCEIKSSYWVKHHSHTHTAPITAAEVTPIHQSHSFSSHSILHIFIYFFGVHCCPSMLTSRQASQEVLWEAVRSWSLLFTFWLHSKWAFFFSFLASLSHSQTDILDAYFVR